MAASTDSLSDDEDQPSLQQYAFVATTGFAQRLADSGTVKHTLKSNTVKHMLKSHRVRNTLKSHSLIHSEIHTENTQVKYKLKSRSNTQKITHGQIH